MGFSHTLFGFLALAAALASASPAGAQQQTPAPAQQNPASAYNVVYFEVAPSAAKQGVAPLRQYVEAARKAPGNTWCQALEEIGRPGRFAIVSTWRDQAALNAHTEALHTLEERMRARLIGPFDVRPSNGISVAPSKGPPGPRTVLVLTHVDVVPTHKDEGQALVETLAKDARSERGNLWFDVLQQANRANHFTLYEAWSGRKALDQHIEAPATRQFRDKLKPLQGALYDERFYRALR